MDVIIVVLRQGRPGDLILVQTYFLYSEAQSSLTTLWCRIWIPRDEDQDSC